MHGGMSDDCRRRWCRCSTFVADPGIRTPLFLTRISRVQLSERRGTFRRPIRQSNLIVEDVIKKYIPSNIMFIIHNYRLIIFLIEIPFISVN
jgi:hypothetical protein